MKTLMQNSWKKSSIIIIIIIIAILSFNGCSNNKNRVMLLPNTKNIEPGSMLSIDLELYFPKWYVKTIKNVKLIANQYISKKDYAISKNKNIIEIKKCRKLFSVTIFKPNVSIKNST